MATERQLRQLVTNCDIQSAKNYGTIQMYEQKISQFSTKIRNLESTLNKVNREYAQSQFNYECALETIEILYREILTLRQRDVDKYYSLLDKIKTLDTKFFKRLLKNCNPRVSIHSISYLDEYITIATAYIAQQTSLEIRS